MLPELHTEIPGPRSKALAAELRRYESPNVTFVTSDWPVFWERAEGVNVWDADGNRFLDFTSAFGVSGLGHGFPPARDALIDQARRLPHAMGDVHPAAAKVELLKALNSATYGRWGGGAAKTILCNSGFEAVEAAIKTSILHTGLPGVLAFEGAYHGLGYGALDTTELPLFRAPFRRQLPGFTVHAPFPACYRCPWGERSGYRLEGREFPNCSSRCLAKLEQILEQELARRPVGCILAEPIQGRGGERVPPRDFLRLLRTICDRHKILLIFDEIYTGWNRTGQLFACDHSGVMPDIICTGKALTGLMPLSACTGRAEIMNAWPPSEGEALHTSTFLGNPMACAAANAAILTHLNRETAVRVRDAGQQLHDALRSLKSPRLGDVRGAGLLAGLEVVHARSGEPDGEGVGRIVIAALKDGLLLLAGGAEGNVLSLTPPFDISPEEIAWTAERLQEYLMSL